MSSVATALRAQAATLIALAESLEAKQEALPAVGQPAAAPAAPKRGRGRPVAGEAPAAPAASAAPVADKDRPQTEAEIDPFAPAAPAAPTPPPATRDEVSAALRALSAATSQEKALSILKETGGGAANLTDLKPEFYGVVAAAAKGAMPVPKVAAPVAEADPFEASAPVGAPAAAVEKLPTREEVKAVVVATQKRTSTETVQKILMEHGGKAEDANRVMQPSLRALPEANFVKFIAALNALPATK